MHIVVVDDRDVAFTEGGKPEELKFFYTDYSLSVEIT